MTTIPEILQVFNNINLIDVNIAKQIAHVNEIINNINEQLNFLFLFTYFIYLIIKRNSQVFIDDQRDPHPKKISPVLMDCTDMKKKKKRKQWRQRNVHRPPKSAT